MKNALKIFVLLLPLFGFSQTKYVSLADACAKNASGSGFTNNARTVNIPNYAIGSRVFVGNTTTKGVSAGYRYYPALNESYRTDNRGNIIERNVCASGGNHNLFFEQNTLQGLIDGTNDVAENRLDLNVFPATPPTTTNLYVNLINGSGLEYLNAGGNQITSRKIATGLGNNKLWSLAEVPNQERSGWEVYMCPTCNNTTDFLNFGISEGNNIMNGKLRDKNNAIVKPAWWMSDTETPEWVSSPNLTNFLEGFYNTAKPQFADFKLLMYGRSLTTQFPTHNPQGDLNYIFPKMNPTLVNDHTTSSGIVLPVFGNKDYFFDVANYLKSPKPHFNTIYQSNGSGGYLTDGFGNRLYRNSGFNEVYRGINHFWDLSCSGCPPDAASGERYRNVVPEFHLAIYQYYQLYGRLVSTLQMVANQLGIPNNNIENIHSVMPYKMMFTNRLTFEANTWRNTYRPLDKYSAALSTYIGFTFMRNVWWWDGYTTVVGVTNNGSGTFQAVNEGNNANIAPEPFGNAPGSYPFHNGALRQSYAIQYENMMLNRDYGFCKKTTKILAFTDYRFVDGRKEILGFGELEGSSARIILAYPLLDFNETKTVTIGNTLNSQTFTVTVGSNEVKRGVYTFTGTGNLNANQIWIQYQSINGQTYKHSGNLVNHDI